MVLDTNVALSGLLRDGPPFRLLTAAEAGHADVFSSVALLTELRNGLSGRGHCLLVLSHFSDHCCPGTDIRDDLK